MTRGSVRNQNETMFFISAVNLIFGITKSEMFTIISNAILFGLILIYLLYKYKSHRKQLIFEQVIVVYYCCFQLVLRGVPAIWFNIFSISLDQHLVQFVTLLIVIAFTFAQVQPMTEISILQSILEQLILIITFLYKKYNFTNLKKHTQNKLLKQIINNVRYYTFDHKQNEVNGDNLMPSEQIQISNATLFSSRSENQKLQCQIRKDIKIKCYTKQQLDMAQQSQLITLKPSVFDTMAGFLEFYQKGKHQMKDNVILASEYEEPTGRKQQYRLYIEQFKQIQKVYTLVAFVSLQDKIPSKQNKYIDKFKVSLSKIFTHKLKTPLNTTLGFLQAIVQENNTIDEQLKSNFLKPAFINSKIQYYQVQDILDYVNSAKLVTFKVSKVNLHKTLQLIYDMIELQCRAKQIQVVFTVNSKPFDINERYLITAFYDRPIYLSTDQLRLERILFNLLNKSYRHTQIKGKIQLKVDVLTEHNQVQFKINDNVQGFKQEQFEQINNFAKLQNQCIHGFRNSIAKRSTFKFSLTLQITNKLIYFLSDFQCSLQINHDLDDGASYHFFISLNCQQENLQQSFEVSQRNLSFQRKNSNSLKKHLPNHISLFTTNKNQTSDKILEEYEIDVEPLANKPLQLSTQMVQTSPKSTLLKNQPVQQSILPFHKSVFQKEIIDKSLTISMAFDHSFNVKRITDSIDIRQDMNQTIMLVDDEPFNHDTLKLMLKSLGFKNFISAYHGQQCIELVTKHYKSIKVIFMDLDMPIMGGIKVLVQQMQDGEIDYIPIVACTAHDDKDTQQECLMAGMIYIIAKPVFIRSLQETFLRINEIKVKSQNYIFGSKAISSSIK
ncbi:unnamed protein product (macronuclear) [Paramecium tetraurelia]|uniref:Response regulatory domain-containing protein n=1 Tax=Paramecium tetraurelia TaxID=5888 RepID=A0CA90_PARTE|nr:uncharacterized protein GSPATT00036487001 [Paramecium tetraurelia]CAK67707.1 unnamed protein product [Paramecium tetraurelia]|eukprot:XP_001435104.1 hypothetical protein (macronuclear) [Paramecium tetraurelia strain d4-2]